MPWAVGRLVTWTISKNRNTKVVALPSQKRGLVPAVLATASNTSQKIELACSRSIWNKVSIRLLACRCFSRVLVFVAATEKIKWNKKREKSEKKRIFLILSYLIYMSYTLLTHPSISTYSWTISLVLTGPCGSSAIHAITIQSSHGFLQHFFAHIAYFQHYFSALILFGGNWGAEIARISCAGI